jgi:hypothetical protein
MRGLRLLPGQTVGLYKNQTAKRNELMIIHQSPQGSQEWLQARAGVITASMFKTAREKLKTGANQGQPSAAALNYAFKVAVEGISGMPLDEGFQTWAMQRGNELEPEARMALSAHLDMAIDQCGFVTSDCGRFGASADGLIGHDAGVEIKCLVSPERMRQIILDGDASDFMDQIQGGLWITGRSAWYLAVYCPILSGVNRALTVYRVERDDDYIAALASDLEAFHGLVTEYQSALSLPIAA